MKLKSKFIYAKTLAAFEDMLSNTTEDEINKLSPIVFIEDTSQIWVNKTFFSMGSPNVEVSEKNKIISVDIGEEGFKLSTSGSNLTIKKGADNNIIFSSSALNSINTESPLSWDIVERKLTHQTSGAKEGTYGETSSSDNANLITIPGFTIDKWGHILSIEDKNIQIRDYVEQIPIIDTRGDYNILLGNTPDENSSINVTRKAIGLSYNPSEKRLSIEGGINAGPSKIEGDFVVEGGKIFGIVEGEITGSATPKIHISDKPEYGGASTKLYGHVKVQDAFSGIPAPSSDNADPSASNVNAGIAASPRMVWDVKEELKGVIAGVQAGVNALPIINTIKVNEVEIPTADLDGILGIRVGGGMSAGVDIDNNIVLKSTTLRGYDETEQITEVKSNIKFTKDFKFIEDELSIRWKNIEE